jgi:hypothetical protein
MELSLKKCNFVMVTEKFQNIHLQLSADDIKKIERWKTANGMKSRSEAIRSMIKVATLSGNTKKMSAMKESEAKGFETRDESIGDFTDQIRNIIKEEIEKLNPMPKS